MPDQLDNERELIDQAITDDKAFEVLYEFYFPKIYKFVFARVRHTESAEDIVAKTFMKVFCNLKDYNHEKCPFGAWVFKIATNNLIDYYRYELKRRHTDVEKIVEPVDLNQSPERDVELEQTSHEVQLALQALPKRYQRVLHLKFFAELSNGEIALALHISIGNVGALLHRALKKINKLITSRAQGGQSKV